MHDQSGANGYLGDADARSTHDRIIGSPERDSRSSPAVEEIEYAGSSHSITAPDAAHLRPSFSDSERRSSSERTSPANRPPKDVGHRRKVAKVLMRVSDYLGTASQDRFDDSEFKHGKALDFPEVPAEENRNPDLRQIRRVYNHHRDDDDNLSKRPSRSGSFAGSMVSRPSVDGIVMMSRALSAPHPPPMSRSSSPPPVPPGMRHANTLPTTQNSFELDNSILLDRGRPRQRRDTLEVPVPVHHSSLRNTQPATPTTSIATIGNSQGSPAIVISPDPDTTSAIEETPEPNRPITPLSLEPMPSPKTSPPKASSPP